MKANKIAQIGLLLLLLSGISISILPYLLSPSVQGAPWGQPDLNNPYVQSTRSNRLVFAYFFYWYDWTMSTHFQGVPGCNDELSLHPVNEENVSYLDPNWDYREFKDMITAGIDVFLPDFWGGNGGSGLNTTWDEQGLGPMEIALDCLHAENYNAANVRNVTNPIPKVGMFFDTTCMSLLYPPAADLTNSTQVNTFYKIIKDFYSFFNTTNVQQWPDATNVSAPTAYIVWLYGANYFTRVAQSCLDACKARFLTDFNHSLMFVGTEDWRSGCPNMEGTYHWGTALSGETQVAYSRITIASLGAGMHNGNSTVGAVCTANEPVIAVPRTPEYYSGNWTQVLQGNPNWVVVETWNELFEGTGICRTQEYSDTYINLTGQFSTQFHALPFQSPGAVFLASNPGIFLIAIVGIVALVGIWQSKKMPISAPKATRIADE
ncbi:MAG TPA: hypothetical protein VKK79_04925 [Candidatus Lokiarchaeia archaeon]|nr:hypothetical protein [Candidatus Lokiarchaeia archaeon]